MIMFDRGRLLATIVWTSVVVIWLRSRPCWTRNDIGGLVREVQILKNVKEAYEVRTDLIVDMGGVLNIEEGVELRFAPGVGITVRSQGALVINGSKTKRVLLTRLPLYEASWSDSEDGAAGWPDIRLVDGDTILEGRLQMFYRGRWQSVCTNSKNWTESDLHVACRQMGFSGGLLYHWFPRSNDSSQLLYEQPQCQGDESTLSDCPNWSARQLGSGVCDYHEDIGITCDGNLGNGSASYWRGLKFENAKASDKRLVMSNTVNLVESKSLLANVDIRYAGSDALGNVTSAVQVIGVPPRMRWLDVRWSAYNGLNLTRPNEAFSMVDCVIAENRGMGVFINSSMGLASLTGVTVRDNGGDGVHFVYHESYAYSHESFCETGSLQQSQTYPTRRTHLQRKEQSFVANCNQVFEVASRSGQTLTVHFLSLASDAEGPSSAGYLEVYDGQSLSSRRLASFPVLNNTLVQSVTSTRNIIFIHYRAVRLTYVTFTVEIVANPGKAYDLNLTDCTVTGNNGRGVVVRDQRSGVLVNRTLVAENTHVAGLSVTGGVGDVIVNNSYITGNAGDGVNVTFAGGFMHFDRTSIGNNTGRGLAFWFNETSNVVAFNHSVHITASEVVHNGLYGILVGNQCLSDSIWNISLNSFRGNEDTALVFLSCWHKKRTGDEDTVLITHNQFISSRHLAVSIAPVLHAHVLIEHNEFQEHTRGALYINNLEHDTFKNIAAKVDIQFNRFFQNSGTFVANIGLLQGSPVQELMFTKNHLLENTIAEPFPSLNPRSRVAAVVVVSSDNAVVLRNFFGNPDSTYELGSHLELQQAVIKASYNYWIFTDAKQVYERIFDRKDRYNLARVEFLQYILQPSNLNTTTAVSDFHERDKIIPFREGRQIGGEVSGYERLESGEYVVRRDIYVRPGGKLQVMPGTTLKFDRSIGMMVQGNLQSEGSNDAAFGQITYTVLNDFVGTRTVSRSIRLSNTTEGRLEVFSNGGWGSVCIYGWDIEDAAVACHQLGLVLHPQDWLLEQSQFVHSQHPRFTLTNVQCSILDTDLTCCKAERDFENSCTTQVGLRCYQPSWAGLRLGMAAEESRLRNVVVEHAGLLDFSTNTFKPALQIDFNRHYLERLTLRHNTDSGLGIMWNEIFSSDNRHVVDSQMIGNHRHGLVTRTQGIDITNCRFVDNAASGIHYEPTFSRKEQRDLVTWLNLEDRSTVVSIPQDVQTTLLLGPGDRRYLVFRNSSTPARFRMVTNSGRSLGIMILGTFEKTSTEDVVIYGRLEVGDDVPQWNVRTNRTSFPLKTPGYGVIVDYSPGRHPTGQLILYVASVEGYRGAFVSVSHPTIRIDSCTIQGCGRGISSYHYNRNISDNGDHFHRYSNETILIRSTSITSSKSEAVLVWSPFWDPSISSLAEINYTLVDCQVSSNAKGLLHYSRDIRNSNNLFHWTINDTWFENNAAGGVDIRLPYVWQYSENFTHSFAMYNSTFVANKNFEFSIDGHFARLNMSRNVFRENLCRKGVVSISGMEKELLAEENVIVNNFAQYGVEFNLQSHANKFGVVEAYFRGNVIEDNLDSGAVKAVSYHPVTYALGIRGVQPVNVTRNLLTNINWQFELLAGVLTGSLENTINVAENWWGTVNVTQIQKKIFDFDDWNCYAVADFDPILSKRDVNAGTLQVDIEDRPFDPEAIGGRLFRTVTLPRRDKPYIVSSDLTVMQNVVLNIQPGVVIEFQPSVGILVLGDLVAVGNQNSPIVMRQANMFDARRFRRETDRPLVRLCVMEACGDRRADGFLEMFNTTTEQWIPMCDPRFTERNAQVVCNELNYNKLNVHVMRAPRLDLGPTQIGRIRSWPHPLECTGNEASLAECEYRLNGYINDYRCLHTDDFVYIYCGPDALMTGDDHWGGLRFSIPSFETRSSPLNSPTLGYYSTPSSSILEYVQISGAGVLHGEKSAAVQMVQREVAMNAVTVTESASHGVEAIAVSGSLFFSDLVVKHNLGVGISLLSLTGESSDSTKTDLSYDPLDDVELPYGVFGMVDMCDTNKAMVVQNRLLLYYKYDNRPVDCVKIFSSEHNVKQIGFRLLHFNLFNGTAFAAQPDMISIFDGDIFNYSTPVIADIGWHYGLGNMTKFHVSSDSTLSVQLHTIGGGGRNGFIAEVVTLPISYPMATDTHNNISYSEISRNGQEGIAYRSAGESTPAITLRHNRIIQNGQQLFGNFTVGEAAVLFDVQNVRRLYFYNNLLLGNQGGLHMLVGSQTAVSALKEGQVFNNLFAENRNREALLIRGRKTGVSQSQSIVIFRNYFTRNAAEYRDNIVLSQVKSNLTNNLAYNNTGLHLLEVQGFERVPISYQSCQNNWFWKNSATDLGDRSTIVATKAGQIFTRNYLVNPDNDFELAALNRSIFSLRDSPVNATFNWWGFNETTAISGRIKDHNDFEELLEVQYEPFLADNTSVLSGKCAGGWTKIGDTCFLYVGGSMTFSEAKKFCERDNSSMPYVKTMHDELIGFVEQQQVYYQRFTDRIWIQSIDIPPRECAVLVYRNVITRSCNEYLPFLCERDPEITVTTRLWFMEPLTIAFISVTFLALLFVLLCVIFWLCKSRQRYREKLERRNSIRASIRSNRSLTGFSELGYKRRLESAFKTEPATKVSEVKLNGSVDSIDKTPSRFSCSLDESYDNTPANTSTRTHPEEYPDFVDRFHRDPQLENANVNMLVHPTFDLTYENQGFIDRSASRISHEGSRDWSSTTGSTLDMKRSLDRDSKDEPYQNVPFRNTPSPQQFPSSRDSNSRNGASSTSSSRQPPLETAM